MSEGQRVIESFQDLRAWQEGHALVLLVYHVTRTFPKEEMFGLTMQIRRATVSITSNIAEGFSRNSYKEKVQFYCTSLGSLTEVQNQILIAHDVGFLNDDNFQKVYSQSITVSRILNGLVKSSRSLIRNS